MIVCSCVGTTDRAIRGLLEAGVRPENLGEHCSAGSACGGCRSTLADLLACMTATGSAFIEDEKDRTR